MPNYQIDINADVGEGIGNEELLMPYLSSCNIACGGHAGTISTMVHVVKLAKSHNVKIGAHPSFPDKESFGRVEMVIAQDVLFESLKSQIRSLQSVLEAESLKMHHVKPHGALYNLATKDEKLAKLVLDVIIDVDKRLKLYAPYNSVIANLAGEQQVDVVYEAFADRNYNENLSLVSRQNSNALITEKEAVFEHVFNIISKRKVGTISGVEVDLFADTICVHGDTNNSDAILKYLHQKLQENNVKIL
ncbi:MAG: 5-oxoprolinase subunit PxpA [Winogradskyella sp.]|uniref:5-oxoprolinase subunit PxpA n=1 Tax=Winogradskyella sp. TaxID=1883156 RepID=UPI000F3F1683|nr:5-oxoprolinase subunit PxpA [Winogradskyella sp.]RNC87067.1 MAG: 5-oxoprolinase subunit PxpA [Winogradskyella sp.]